MRFLLRECSTVKIPSTASVGSVPRELAPAEHHAGMRGARVRRCALVFAGNCFCCAAKCSLFTRSSDF